MEIERKWLVTGWPKMDLPLKKVQNMRQGYISVRPTVRIREESEIDCGDLELESNGSTEYILCFKSTGGLARKEIELPVSEEIFRELEDLIGMPLIPKERRSYELPEGLTLEVNHVDAGLPTEFWYAEVEYESMEQARSWDPAAAGLSSYLQDDVSEEPGQSMGAFWEMTRLRESSSVQTEPDC